MTDRRSCDSGAGPGQLGQSPCNAAVLVAKSLRFLKIWGGGDGERDAGEGGFSRLPTPLTTERGKNYVVTRIFLECVAPNSHKMGTRPADVDCFEKHPLVRS